jgi:hypothetical protein
MVTTLFSDAIISSTELKNNQRRWFERACRAPISITNRGGRNFVLINRDQVHNLFLAREYAEKILKYCHELKDATDTGEFASDVFPWAKNLSYDERLEYRDELVSTFTEVIHTNDWSVMDEVISSWEATAEALTNKEFMEVVNSDPVKRKYVEVE